MGRFGFIKPYISCLSCQTVVGCFFWVEMEFLALKSKVLIPTVLKTVSFSFFDCSIMVLRWI